MSDVSSQPGTPVSSEEGSDIGDKQFPNLEVHDGSGPPYYMSLGICTNATSDIVRRAYHEQARIWHPDKNSHRVEEATEMFKLLGEAFDTLSDPAKRAEYDSEMGVEPPQCDMNDAVLVELPGGQESGPPESSVLSSTAAEGQTTHIAKAARLNGAAEGRDGIDIEHLFCDTSDEDEVVDYDCQQDVSGDEMADGSLEWPILDHELEELEWIAPDQWRAASRTFPIKTASTFDGFHCRHIGMLSDDTLELLTCIIMTAELLGMLPDNIRPVAVCLLPKPKGGNRPIGIFTACSRVHGEVRLKYVQDWELKNGRAYLACAKGSGSLDVVWTQKIAC